MDSPLIKRLKPAWHAYKRARDKARWFYGAAASMSAETDYQKVVLICNYGRGYLCNPKYIGEALNREYPGQFDLVCLVRKHLKDAPPYIRQVRYGTRAAQRELASARVWIDNCRGLKYVPKRNDQVYIQTWHASLGPKRCEGDVADHLYPKYVQDAMQDGAITDLMFADNALEAGVFQRAFWYEGPVLKIGVPRNRPLADPCPSAVSAVKDKLGVAQDTSICLYAPTFRNDWSVEAYKFDHKRFVRELEGRFRKPFVFAYRLHPNIAKLGSLDFMEGAIDATSYPDAQELLAATDVLVSDYSSIMDDFVLTGRPGFAFIADLESYLDDRGLYYPLTDRPFPVAQNEDELIAAVRDFDEASFEAKRKGFMEEMRFSDNGRGAEDLAMVIKRLSKPGTTLDEAIDDIEIWPVCKQ